MGRHEAKPDVLHREAGRPRRLQRQPQLALVLRARRLERVRIAAHCLVDHEEDGEEEGWHVDELVEAHLRSRGCGGRGRDDDGLHPSAVDEVLRAAHPEAAKDREGRCSSPIDNLAPLNEALDGDVHDGSLCGHGSHRDGEWPLPDGVGDTCKHRSWWAVRPGTAGPPETGRTCEWLNRPCANSYTAHRKAPDGSRTEHESARWVSRQRQSRARAGSSCGLPKRRAARALMAT
eukprot:scaffold23312_cov67-Phaeocystis_antarctica.AAC.9